MTPGHVTTARALIGTRWGHRARGPFRVDCAGLVVLALLANGHAVEDQADYGREPALNVNSRLRAALRTHFGEPVSVPMVGDVGLFRGAGSEHVGIFGNYRFGGLSLIHASNEPGLMRVVEHRFAGTWQRRFLEAYRPGVR